MVAGPVLTDRDRREYREGVDAHTRAGGSGRVVDAADRTELDRLRRRVYGPEGDDSRATLARLEELEAELHREVPPPAAEPVADLVTAMPAEQTTNPRAARLSPGRMTAILIAVAVALFLGFRLLALLPSPDPVVRTETVTAREAYSLIRDDDMIVLQELPYAEPTPDPDAPDFPTSGTVTAAARIGTVYGWDVWIADAEGAIQPEQCIVAVRPPLARGRCVPAVLRDTSALAVTIPATAIDPAERPAGLRDDERVGFWWAGDAGGIFVLRGDQPDLSVFR